MQDSTYKTAGSVHGCALFRRDEMLTFVEDVGRHNAIDTIAGWMWMQDVKPPRSALACPRCPRGGASAWAARGARSCVEMSGADKVFYTTGRLTSEMVIKAAQMGIPIVVSRSGITQMGLEVAQRLDLCAIGRATNKRFLCFSGAQRLQLQPELAGAKLRVVA